MGVGGRHRDHSRHSRRVGVLHRRRAPGRVPGERARVARLRGRESGLYTSTATTMPSDPGRTREGLAVRHHHPDGRRRRVVDADVAVEVLDSRTGRGDGGPVGQPLRTRARRQDVVDRNSATKQTRTGSWWTFPRCRSTDGRRPGRWPKTSLSRRTTNPQLRPRTRTPGKSRARGRFGDLRVLRVQHRKGQGWGIADHLVPPPSTRRRMAFANTSWPGR